MELIAYQRKKTYDGVLRLIHGWNGLAILALMMTVWASTLFEQGAAEHALWQAHVYIGFALVLGLVARVTWGIAGPATARFSDMWHPRAWADAARHFSLHRQAGFGHDPMASAAYLTVYVLLGIMAATGLSLAAIEHDMGPLTPWLGDSIWLKNAIKAPHEFIYNVLLVFVGVHLAALVWHEKRDRRPIAQAMVSGYQYVPHSIGDDNA
jgi:Ni/Fe-hydrogenase 1 B-type cytochrome subunit